MNNIRLVLIGLMGLTSSALAADPFRVVIQPLSAADHSRILNVEVTIPDRHLLYADQFRLEVPAPAMLRPLSPPKPERKADSLSGDEKLVFAHSFQAQYAVENLLTNFVSITVKRRGCNESVCFLPVTETVQVVWDKHESPSNADVNMTVMPAKWTTTDWRSLTNRFGAGQQRVGYLTTSELVAFLESAKEPSTTANQTPLRKWLTNSLWLSLLTILLGGLALNLTPCVLPMIPVNLAIIGAGDGATSRQRGLIRGALYGAGIAFAYGILGLLVVLTGAKFGAINASPWFNIGVAVIFVVLALAMFDLIYIDFSRFQGKIDLNGLRHGWLVVMTLGALSAILSGACVAPVVFAVLLIAANLYANGNIAGLALPFILGVGMALPWPFAGAGLAWLPKPGRWMERIKQGFGILILLMAAYYAYTAITIWRQKPLDVASKGWLTSLPEALIQADIEKKPVFIDFRASWCKNCHAMDATTFKDLEAQKRLDGFIKVMVQAEHPNLAPDRDILDAFGVIGLPTYVILKPKS